MFSTVSCYVQNSYNQLQYVTDRQGCAQFTFFWADSTPAHLQLGGTTLTQLNTLLFYWLKSDSTQIPNLLTWLNFDSSHSSQVWVKSESQLITFCLHWPKVVERGGGMQPNIDVGWFFLCYATQNCKILPFSVQKNRWLNFDSSSTQLNQL